MILVDGNFRSDSEAQGLPSLGFVIAPASRFALKGYSQRRLLRIPK